MVMGELDIGPRSANSIYSRDDGARRGSRYEEINHSSLLNVGENVDGDGRSESRSQNINSP